MSEKPKKRWQKEAIYAGVGVGIPVFIILLLFLLPWSTPTVQETPLPEWGVVEQSSEAAAAWLANKAKPGRYTKIEDEKLAVELIAKNPTVVFVDECSGVEATVAWVSLVGRRVTIYRKTYMTPSGYQTKSGCQLKEGEEGALIVPTQRHTSFALLMVAFGGVVGYLIGLLITAIVGGCLNWWAIRSKGQKPA